MKFIQIYTIHFFLLGIMGMAYSMPEPMSKEDEQKKRFHDIFVGSPKEQGNTGLKIRYNIPKDTGNSDKNASNSSGNASNSSGNASNNTQR